MLRSQDLGSKADPLLKNVSYFLAKFVAISLFALALGAFNLCNTHKVIKKERDDAIAHSAKGAYEYCHLHNKYKDTENVLHTANEKLQDANNDADEERKEFRDTIQDLNDQHQVDQEEIRSLKQHVSNTECDRDEHFRRFGYASRANKKLAQENQDFAREKQNLAKENQKLEHEKQRLKLENQQLEALMTEKDKTINHLQAQANDTAPEAVAVAPSSPIYILPNDQTEMHQQMQQPCTAMPSLSDTFPEQAAADGRVSERDGRIRDLEQQNQTLASENERLVTDLETLRDEHGKCTEHLRTQLAKKDGDLSTLQAEKETANKDSTETIAVLQAELDKKEQEVEEANGALVANRASSADNVQRLETLSSELEVSRLARAQSDKDSAEQKSRIGELTASKAHLEDTLRVKNDEIATLQMCVSDSRKDLEELQKTHATCNEHASSQALEQQNQALLDLRTFSQSETLSLEARIQTLNQTVDKQRQQIHTLKTNCPKCQDLRVVLDAVVTDVKMSDDESMAEMKREVREELRTQVPDDLRRQLRVEVERSLRDEFQKRYSDLHASNSKRIQEQDRLIRDKSAELEKARNIPSICVSHAACEKKEGNLLASITKLENDAKILRGNCSRLTSSAQNDREQLKSVQTANEDLRRELETIKADQRRAQNVNPLQSKLKACQREVEKMKEDRDKARNNCSIYSKNLSDMKKKYEALEKEHSTFVNEGEQQWPEGSSPDDWSSTMNMDEATALDVLRHEVDLREARDGKKAVYAMPPTSACPALKSPPEIARTRDLQPAPQPTTNFALVAGKKRDRAKYSDGEEDDEEGDDRKKVKMDHLKMSKGNVTS